MALLSACTKTSVTHSLRGLPHYIPPERSCTSRCRFWRQAAVQVRIAPDCKSERDFVPAAKSLKNKLFLGDRGYDGVGYLSEIDTAGGFFAVRMRSNANPIIHRVLSGSKRLRREVGKPPDRQVTGIREREGVVLLRREERVVKLAIGVGRPARGA